MTNSGKRGGTVASNDNGVLERDGSSSTYIGTATLDDGKVLTKRFRGNVKDEPRIIESWKRWQGRKADGEEEVAVENSKKAKECPLSGRACGAACPMFSQSNRACSLALGAIGLYNMTCNVMKLDPNESLELIAMAVSEIGGKGVGKAAPQPHGTTEKDGLDAYLDGKTFVRFVNLSSKKVHAEYAAFCRENGYQPYGEHDMMQAIASRYSELKVKGVRGGSVFEAA